MGLKARTVPEMLLLIAKVECAVEICANLRQRHVDRVDSGPSDTLYPSLKVSVACRKSEGILGKLPTARKRFLFLLRLKLKRNQPETPRQ